MNVESWDDAINAEPELQPVRMTLELRFAVIAESRVISTEVDLKTGPHCARLGFWDKPSKGDYYLEFSIQLADESFDGRRVSYFAGDLISNGGQWDMVVNPPEAYGVVTQTLYLEYLLSLLFVLVNTLLKSQA